MKKRKFDAPAEMSEEKNINLILLGEPEEVKNEDSYHMKLLMTTTARHH